MKYIWGKNTAMKTITTNEGSLILTETGRPIQTIPFGLQYATTAGDNVVVESGSKRWSLPMTTTVDGESFLTADELAEKIASFKKGGGDGGGGETPGVTGVQSVTGDLVSGTAQNPVVNAPDWDQVGDKPTEFPASAHTHTVSQITDLNIQQTPEALSTAGRTGTGQVKGQTAVENDDLVNLEQLNSGLATKVDTQEGYGLSPEPFTQDEKDKLANVEDPKFQGQFPSEADLQANGEGGAGNYAYVDGGPGEPVHLYAWNSTTNTWDLVAGESTAETPTSVLQKYEANPDRNPFTDVRRDKLDSITAIFTAALKTVYDQAVAWITTNGQNLLSHLTNTNNPHNVTAEQVGLGDIDERLSNKADLVDGKIPVEQLPEVQSEDSTLVAQQVATTTTQYIIADIPADAPDLLRFELFIPDTAVPAYISLRLNNNATSIYKHVLQNVNAASYSMIRNYSQNQIRVLASTTGSVVGRYNIRIEGTITNVAGQLKIANGTAYLAGVTPSDPPDVNNFFGSAHLQAITDGKINQLQFVAMAAGGDARIRPGSVLKVYGIK